MSSITIRLPRLFIFALLASFFLLAFIISPYWFLGRSSIEMAVILMGTIGLGGLWGYVASSEINLRLSTKDAAYFVGLLAALFLLNYKSLTADIPWRGDEDHHIRISLYLAERVPLRAILCLFIPFMAFWLAAWRGMKKTMTLIGVLLVCGIVFFLLHAGPFQGERPDWIFRYPLLNYWFFMLIPRAAGYSIGPYHEILYRIVPLISMALLAHVFQAELTNKIGVAALFWGCAVATIPFVLYYQ